MLPENTNPRFRAWLDAQPADVARAVAEQWQSIESHPDISATHKHADHARLTLLIEYCATNYGYER